MQWHEGSPKIATVTQADLGITMKYYDFGKYIDEGKLRYKITWATVIPMVLAYYNCVDFTLM